MASIYSHSWPTVLKEDQITLRPLRLRDRSAWLAVRKTNRAWLSQWEATSPISHENKDIAHDLKLNEGIRLAYLGKTFAVTESTMKQLTGKPGAKCPENNKSIPLISSNGSACVSCGLCVYGKADIRFSASKK